MNNKNNEELQFVAKHYKPNCLNTNQAWQRFKERRGIKGWGGKRKIAVAASITLAIGFAVAAGIMAITITCCHKSLYKIKYGQTQP